uniref:Phage tail tape measure protein, TP901 family, core region n=1 Tax=Candidatus Kentrum sp. TC TaxID=2126339 RepID=A0A450YW86_9GAMM|nr:MAG: phage tail tape measure protein, TP901 family, core region [Candidatus Kentron sp. TC]
MLGSMMNIGLLLTARDRMSSVVMSAADQSLTAIGRVGDGFSRLSDRAERFGVGAMRAGLEAAGAATGVLYSYARLEDASVGLRSALLTNTGDVGEEFAGIEKRAISLGNILPGTTADFLGAATALKEQGVGLKTILTGGLDAASYLSVVLRLPADAAAEMTAKLRESYGLADDELTKMADLAQRAKFAFGMTPEDIKIAAGYSGATQNILGLTGLANARKLLALQGLGAGVSLEGSSWGTNFAMLLTRTAETSGRLAKNSKQMRALNAQLGEAGIHLSFFDDEGAFLGLDHMVAQLEKTNVLSQSAQLDVFKQLFGVEAGRAAAIIAKKGVAGYQDAIEKMEKQASLQQRIDLSLTTLGNTWEALTGTATNAVAAMGKPLAAFVKPYISRMNAFVGGPLMNFIEGHERLTGGLGVSLLAFGLLALSLGALGMVASNAFAAMAMGARALSAASSAARFSIRWLGAQRRAVMASTMAFRILNTTMLLNPIIFIGTAFALAALLVYKYWKPISAFFGGMWRGLREGIAPLMPVLQRLVAVFGAVFSPLLSLIRPVAGWFSRLFAQVSDTGGAAASMGEAFGRAIAGFLVSIGEFVSSILSLPGRLYDAGVEMVKGLVGGITSMGGAAVDAVKGIGRDMMSGFKGLLGIESPSRVFLGFGDNIALGAAIGVEEGLPRMRRAMLEMAAMTDIEGAVPARRKVPLARGGAGQSSTATAGDRVVIHFSPVIHARGADPASVKSAVADSFPEFERNMRRYIAEKGRIALR